MHLPTTSQTILLRIVFISSNEKARSVWERTLPRADTQRKRGRGLIVRRLADRKELSVQYRSLTVTPLFFAISLKASARPTVSLTLRGGDQAGWLGKVDAAALLGLVLGHSMSPAAV